MKPKFESMLGSFPQEIAHDILHRLPIKSLIICTSVCKTWRYMIINQSFIQSHLTRTNRSRNQNDSHRLLLHSVAWSHRASSFLSHSNVDQELIQEVYYVHYDNEAFEEYSKIEFPMALKKALANEFFRVVGICNGLVCVADDIAIYGYEFRIWNPFIRKSVILPRPGLRFETFGPYDATVGFGFDAIGNDYKVVRILTPYKDWPRDPCEAEVYSLATGSWKNLGSVSPHCEVDGREEPAFVNGVLHWHAARNEDHYGSHYFILTFDVGSEFFGEILMPQSFIRSFSLMLQLSVSHDRKSIALFAVENRSNDTFLDIWVMTEYCIVESWTKLISLGRQGPERLFPKALSFRKNGEVLLMLLKEYRIQWYHKHDISASKTQLVSLDLVSKQLKNLGISQYPYFYVDSYGESLFLLDKTEAVSY